MTKITFTRFRLCISKIQGYQHPLIGAAVGAYLNSLKYRVTTGERSSNILNINVNDTWYARIDKPHKHFPHHHINVNPEITGVPDPHIKLNESIAYFFGELGQAIDVVNKSAWVLYIAGIIANDGKSHIDFVTANIGGLCGAKIGATLGSVIFPGVGDMFGSIVGGACGGAIGKSMASSLKLRTFFIKKR